MNSFRIGWSAIVGTISIAMLIGYADAQLARMKPVPDDTVQTYAMRRPSSDGWLPPNERTVEKVALQPKPPAVVDRPVVIPPVTNLPPIVIPKHGMGGKVHEHRMIFAAYRQSGAPVELRGPCYSACTLLTAYVGKDKLCIAPGAFMAFHAVRMMETGVRSDAETALMYHSFPLEIQRWIDRNGGHENLPLNGFWTMYDRDLWAMGYPKYEARP